MRSGCSGPSTAISVSSMRAVAGTIGRERPPRPQETRASLCSLRYTRSREETSIAPRELAFLSWSSASIIANRWLNASRMNDATSLRAMDRLSTSIGHITLLYLSCLSLSEHVFVKCVIEISNFNLFYSKCLDGTQKCTEYRTI